MPKLCYNGRILSEIMHLNTRERIRERKPDVLRIAEKNRIDEILLFGSCARGEATSKSDIDFLVSFAPGASLLDQVHARNELQDLFGTPVDVVSRRGLSPYVASSILSEAVPL